MATTIISHIRLASVGNVTAENTHPYRFGNWAFAHNGTVEVFSKVQEAILALIPAHIRKNIKGSTDSEHVFHLLLSEMERQGMDLKDPYPDERDVVKALRKTLSLVNGLSHKAGASYNSRLNILLTNGKVLWGTRFGHPLNYLMDSELTCTCCGPRDAGFSVTIATELLTDEDHWHSFPENTVFYAHISPRHISMEELLIDVDPTFSPVTEGDLADRRKDRPKVCTTPAPQE
jgi:glutamine amidotransferase